MIYNLSTIFFSPTGTSAKIAKHITKSLGGIHKEYDLTSLKTEINLKPWNLAPTTL